MKPSDNCGPFAGHQLVSDVVSDETEDSQHYIMDIVLSPGMVVGIIVVLWCVNIPQASTIILILSIQCKRVTSPIPNLEMKMMSCDVGFQCYKSIMLFML